LLLVAHNLLLHCGIDFVGLVYVTASISVLPRVAGIFGGAGGGTAAGGGGEGEGEGGRPAGAAVAAHHGVQPVGDHRGDTHPRG